MPRGRMLCFVCVMFVSVTLLLGQSASETKVQSEAAREIKNSLGMQFVLIPPGAFDMGAQKGEPARDDEDLHSVRLTKAFYLSKYEVTVGQFRDFVNGNSKTVNGKKVPFMTSAERGGQSFEGGKPGGFRLTNSDIDVWDSAASWRHAGWQQQDNFPAAFISWEDANAFVLWLSKKEGKRYRLPTEAEWEYACRAGSSSAYWWGDAPDTTGKVANVADRSFKTQFPSMIDIMDMDDGHAFMAPVGSYKPNAFGTYDMIGNAWEWVADYYDPHLKESTDPKGPETGFERVARGGGYGTPPDRCRCAARFHDPPLTRYSGTGFRVALEID